MADATRTVVVATTALLTFISFWRAAAIVLSDLGSSAYYAGGIAEHAIGKSAPWFILGIMLFGFAIRAIYVESSSMFVRGGVYKVVREAMGGTLAKFSVSALIFDYILTGPISGVSAGLYLAGIINETAYYLQRPWHVRSPLFAAAFALLVTVYFWFENVIGIRESSDKALRIMQLTTVMVVILIGWCALTVFTRGYQPVPLPVRQNLHFGPGALGWLEGTAAPSITAIAIMIGLGHSLLAMSGFETLAQIYRDIEAPKLPNLRRTGLVAIVYALVFTSSVSFFAVMLIPDSVRPQYFDNLIGGLSMFLAGPTGVKLAFHGFVVLVGVLLLSGAVNTSIIGSNGVLNRIAEDGVLPDWFREPHHRHGTTSRIINLVTVLQIATIVLSRGNVIMLGEAYAFGVVWSFAMKALAVLVLRYKHPNVQRWKVPLNLKIGRREIPIGLMAITVALFSLALINVLTKKTATIAGSIFTIVFFTIFSLSERRTARTGKHFVDITEKFHLEEREELSLEDLHVRPGNVLIYIRDSDRLRHLERVLQEATLEKQDLIAIVVHRLSGMASAEYELDRNQICGDREIQLLSRVVAVAEKVGKPVQLLCVPAKNPYCALIQTAQSLQSSRIVDMQSPRLSMEEQARQFREAWEELPEPRPAMTLEIVPEGEGPPVVFSIGPHKPRLWPADIELIERLWAELTERFGLTARLHHRDVVGVALRRFEEQLHASESAELLEDLRRDLEER